MSTCNCTLRERLVGDGCSICNPAKALEYAMENLEETEQQRDKLLEALKECYSAFWLTDESPGQSDAIEKARAIIAEIKATK